MDPSDQIDKKIASLRDWRGVEMARLRRIINGTDQNLKEDWKWGTPVWTCGGLVVALGAFKDHLKLNFFRGGSLKDPHHLFNAGLDAKETRGIDIHEGDKVDEAGLKSLIRDAIRFNKT